MRERGPSQLSVDTPVAKASPPRKGLITRRVALLGGLWFSLFLALLGSEYSSASGWKQVAARLQQQGVLPGGPGGGKASGCSL